MKLKNYEPIELDDMRGAGGRRHERKMGRRRQKTIKKLVAMSGDAVNNRIKRRMRADTEAFAAEVHRSLIGVENAEALQAEILGDEPTRYEGIAKTDGETQTGTLTVDQVKPKRTRKKATEPVVAVTGELADNAADEWQKNTKVPAKPRKKKEAA